MITVEGLSKSYGPIQALRGVSFQIGEGEIVGLLGPNGAGKTTIIKILTGYLQPDDGIVEVNGLDVLEEPKAVQRVLGYLPETAPLYPELTVQDYLQFIAEMRQIPEAERLERIGYAVYAVGLQNHLTRPIGQLSKGYRQRVGLAQAILHRPRFLILDEPTVGLDPTQIVEMRRLIKSLAKESTILFSTHILSEVEALCDRAIILINGQIRADARLEALAASPDLVMVLEREAEGVMEALRSLPGVHAVEDFREEGYPAYRLHSDEAQIEALPPAVFELAKAREWTLRELRRERRTLEMVFNELAMAA